KADPALAADYLAADAAGRADLVEALAGRDLPTAGQIAGPYIPGIEYDVSLRRLCALMEAVADLSFVSLNPGLADPEAWAEIAFKGGSETGVLNFTTRVVDASGQRYCVAFTWNDAAALDEARAAALYGALLERLSRGG